MQQGNVCLWSTNNTDNIRTYKDGKLATQPISVALESISSEPQRLKVKNMTQEGWEIEFYTTGDAAHLKKGDTAILIFPNGDVDMKD